MKRAALLMLLVITAATATAQPAAQSTHYFVPRSLFPGIAPICTPEDLRTISIPNTTVESITSDPTDGSCRVTASVRHPPANNRVMVYIALPMTGWNGRFRGNGGGGFSGGSPASLRVPLMHGFATGYTDTGHIGGRADFAIEENRQFNWQAIRDNAYLGIHAMTVVGKALVQAFYGRPPLYSYFVGSSTGGRQGLMEAQRYPEDYDGIISGCPAINWHRFLPAALWPQVVMNEADNFLPKSKLDAATAAAIAACDATDGVIDGIIDDPRRCFYDPQALIGTLVSGSIFTASDANIIRKIWQGPRGHGGRFLWYGLLPGTDLSTYAGTSGSPLTGKPFGIPLDWFRYFLMQDPQWDWTSMTSANFELLWNQSVDQFGAIFGTDNPDLTRFRDRGGKLIITHGLADQQIPPEGTIEYYERLQQQMGGFQETADFARLFLMPGLNHGFRGAPAPNPEWMMAAIIRWVEEGEAPERIVGEQYDDTGKLIRTRPFYPYPSVARYKGSGSADDAANFLRQTQSQ